LPGPASSSRYRHDRLSQTKRPSPRIIGRPVHSVAAACSSSKPSSAPPSHAQRRVPPAHPDQVRRDPAQPAQLQDPSPALIDGDPRPSPTRRASTGASRRGSCVSTRCETQHRLPASPPQPAHHPRAADLPSPGHPLNPHAERHRTAGSFLGDFGAPAASETFYKSGRSALGGASVKGPQERQATIAAPDLFC
jgi:hypothetical protein